MALTLEQKKYIENHLLEFSHLIQRDYMTEEGYFQKNRWNRYLACLQELETMRDSESLIQDTRSFIDDTLAKHPEKEETIYCWYQDQRIRARQEQLLPVLSNDDARVFVDMDGTLYRFHDAILDEEEQVQIEKMYEPHFFETLKSFDSLQLALRHLHEDRPELELFILSSADTANIIHQKNICIDRDLPFIDTAHRLYPKTWETKSDVIPGGIRNTDILIDDYNKNLREWEKEGGTAIKFINNINHKGTGRFGGDVGRLWEGQTLDFRYGSLDLADAIQEVVDQIVLLSKSKDSPEVSR